MSNWILHASEDWLKPIYEELHKGLVKSAVLHADETTLQVLKEPGKSAQSKSYMWLYRTSGDTDKPIVLYEFTPNRKPAYAQAFLKGFCGYLHADGYQGYHNLPPDIVVVGCMAHARRKLTEALDVVPKEQRESCEAGIGFAYIRGCTLSKKAYGKIHRKNATGSVRNSQNLFLRLCWYGQKR